MSVKQENESRNDSQERDAEQLPPPGAFSNCIFVHDDPDERPYDRPLEIVEGILRVGQFCILCGYYSIGKTPLVHDLAFHVTNGYQWFDRKVSARPVSLFDFETAVADYERNITALARRYENDSVYPTAYLFTAPEHRPLVTPLRRFVTPRHKMGKKDWEQRMHWIRSLLRVSPNALFIFDPADLFFHFHRNKSSHVLRLSVQLRELLLEFPDAAIILVMNLRKRGHRRRPVSLFKEPLRWLEDNAGDLDLLNRSDVRLGFDYHDDPVLRVLHGIRRGEEVQPIVVRQIGTPGELAGFEQEVLPESSVRLSLTAAEEQYFVSLPESFRFVEAVRTYSVPRSTLSRLLKAARSLGLLSSEGGIHRKI